MHIVPFMMLRRKVVLILPRNSSDLVRMLETAEERNWRRLPVEVLNSCPSGTLDLRWNKDVVQLVENSPDWLPNVYRTAHGTRRVGPKGCATKAEPQFSKGPICFSLIMKWIEVSRTKMVAPLWIDFLRSAGKMRNGTRCASILG